MLRHSFPLHAKAVKVKRVEGRFLLSFLRCLLRVKDLKVYETCESR